MYETEGDTTVLQADGRKRSYSRAMTVRSASMLVAILVLAVAPHGAAQGEDELAAIRKLRLEGALAEARTLAEGKLAAGGLDPHQEIDLHLELARIHNRIGLHQNSRPVPAVLRQIEAAAAVTTDPSLLAQAKIELARSDYQYRAEMQEREFPMATIHADRAIELYREVGDKHGEADAVHRRGLIHIQRREYELAHELFDRSLELDRAAGERPVFRGDYERHVGFVYLFEGDVAASIPYFERSLAFRRQAGAVDASLFAARILASALVDLGRLEEARPILLYAMMVAEKLDSPTGKARNGLVLGQMYEQSGDDAAARTAFEMTLAVAESIGYTSIAQQSRASLERLDSKRVP
jgi:tetratricopeptide (TPR) repeat protein